MSRFTSNKIQRKFKERNTSCAVVPFLHHFKYPLGLKSDLLVEGEILDNADRFNIDLCQSTDSGKNVALHFSVRLNLNYVARNTLLKGLWGPEEGYSMGKIPFKKGERFIIEIFLIKEHFLISVNSTHFCRYVHRVPPLYIDSLEIYGDVKLRRVELSKRDVYPTILSFHDYNLLGTHLRNSTNTAWLTPLNYKFEDILSPGWKIVINGRVKLLPHRINFNLQSGPHVYPSPLVGLHLSVRWNGKGDDTIVFNTKDENWNQEIVTPMELLFCPGRKFELQISIKSEYFKLKVDSTPLPFYPCRLTSKYVPVLNFLNTLYIEGDAEIFNIKSVRPEHNGQQFL
ncbi:galectin-8-like isoform X2 [Cimex lectularius]|uniref:Galectin n=1 Tax=Cimex lectularius TaxID=79782 RepID=A0A8I6TH64_CIMLE|nr:galectin-8-like isoform X2 [Cimex lectularius]